MTPQEAIQAALNASNSAAAMGRKALEEIALMRREVAVAARDAAQDAISKARPGARGDRQYIDSLPGKRIPFDIVVSVPVAADSPGPYSQTAQVSTDGHFVATHRYATFLSQYIFQVTSDGNETAQFAGRSNGRYRPVHSVCDLFDGQGGWNVPIAAADPGDGTWQVEHTTNRSGFRSMEFDGLIEVVSQESNYRRQQNPVPTSLWAPGFTGIQELPAWDLFKPGAVIEFNIQANHTNNPAAGNIQSIVNVMPFIDSQFDGHEGIGYTAALGAGADDTITRSPDGVLLLGYLGFRILNPREAPWRNLTSAKCPSFRQGQPLQASRRAPTFRFSSSSTRANPTKRGSPLRAASPTQRAQRWEPTRCRAISSSF